MSLAQRKQMLFLLLLAAIVIALLLFAAIEHMSLPSVWQTVMHSLTVGPDYSSRYGP